MIDELKIARIVVGEFRTGIPKDRGEKYGERRENGEQVRPREAEAIGPFHCALAWRAGEREVVHGVVDRHDEAAPEGWLPAAMIAMRNEANEAWDRNVTGDSDPFDARDHHSKVNSRRCFMPGPREESRCRTSSEEQKSPP